ncbi:hypothetical protein DFP72DRAFT_807356 [Ephemerocybe angulata]|uniref:Arrestin-like N-terminal domain-containing protein n=1 Tax=Ephemerocybe angulata TaxID=980116 RepID=A0A8H6I7C6_9AGAR|nr:hypothetical protein DFP72DRAFT_807356 [Tulosesus angulatus]
MSDSTPPLINISIPSSANRRRESDIHALSPTETLPRYSSIASDPFNSSSGPSFRQSNASSSGSRSSSSGRRSTALGSSSEGTSVSDHRNRLPRYSSVFGVEPDQVQLVQDAEENPRLEYKYHLTKGTKQEPWASLGIMSTVRGTGKESAPRIPYFEGAEDVHIEVNLFLKKPVTIHSITATLRGKLTTSRLEADSSTFLEYPISIFEKDTVDASKLQNARADRKLAGANKFKLTFPFPTKVNSRTLTSSPAQTTRSQPGEAPPTAPGAITPFSPFLVRVPNRDEKRPFPSSVAPQSRPPAHLYSDSTNPTDVLTPFPADIQPQQSSRASEKRRLDENIVTLPPPTPQTPLPPAEKHKRRDILEEARQRLEGVRIDEGREGDPLVHFLPPTFLERKILVNLHYEFVIKITHGLLRRQDKIKTNLLHTPSLEPGPFSFKRQTAYAEGRTLPQPADDFEGWEALPPVAMKGELLDQRTIDLECTLFLGKPLTYTRGSVVPCHLTLNSSDIQALNLLAIPSTPRLRLMRRVLYSERGPKTMGAAHPGGGPGAIPDILEKKSRVRTRYSRTFRETLFGPSAKAAGNLTTHEAGLDWEAAIFPDDAVESVDEITCATWWIIPPAVSEGSTPDLSVRKLGGEIHLPPNLKPSCRSPLFSISYNVEFLPLQSHTFRPIPMSSESAGLSEKALQEQVLLTHRVSIATNYCAGLQIPTIYSSPVDIERQDAKRRKRLEADKSSIQASAQGVPATRYGGSVPGKAGGHIGSIIGEELC